jgi:hypothetical protein
MHTSTSLGVVHDMSTLPLWDKPSFTVPRSGQNETEICLRRPGQIARRQLGLKPTVHVA